MKSLPSEMPALWNIYQVKCGAYFTMAKYIPGGEAYFTMAKVISSG
jgi:hypothetical protein